VPATLQGQTIQVFPVLEACDECPIVNTPASIEEAVKALTVEESVPAPPEGLLHIDDSPLETFGSGLELPNLLCVITPDVRAKSLFNATSRTANMLGAIASFCVFAAIFVIHAHGTKRS
jgi:hypothetical protein